MTSQLVVKLVSKECIKPSSPTPHHLKIHKLSLLDQFSHSSYVPVIFFYPTLQPKNTTDDDINDVNVVSRQRTQLLKQSLSETLTDFYPFAGRVIRSREDNPFSLSVDCNDEGAYFVEAQAESPIDLTAFLDHPDYSSLAKLLPSDAGFRNLAVGEHLAMIQVTNFACGGFVVGVQVSHMIADGVALGTFVKAWAARLHMKKKPSDNVSEICKPNFCAFPNEETLPREATMGPSSRLRRGKCALRRFVFDTAAITALKKAVVSSSSVQNPTRVEVITALICKCATAAFLHINAKSSSAAASDDDDEHKKKQRRSTLITHAVNLRQRSVPPISVNYMGNISCSTAPVMCSSSSSAQEMELGSLVSRMRAAINRLDGDFVRGMQGNEGLTKLLEHWKETSEIFSRAASDGEVDYILFYSWCNFGLYNVDFGWGKPLWVSDNGASVQPKPVFMNNAWFLDTRSRDGVEVWLCLDEKEMNVLEHDESFLAFASVDPSPLKDV